MGADVSVRGRRDGRPGRVRQRLQRRRRPRRSALRQRRLRRRAERAVHPSTARGNRLELSVRFPHRAGLRHVRPAGDRRQDASTSTSTASPTSACCPTWSPISRRSVCRRRTSTRCSSRRRSSSGRWEKAAGVPSGAPTCVAGCGNGQIDAGEDCDGADLLNGATCQSRGFPGGQIACDASCHLDTSGCLTQVCGNGVREGTEACDKEHPAASRATAVPPAASSSRTRRRARATRTSAPPICAVAARAYIQPWPMASPAPTPMVTPARPPAARQVSAIRPRSPRTEWPARATRTSAPRMSAAVECARIHPVPRAATFLSIDCRLAALRATVQSDTSGRVQRTLLGRARQGDRLEGGGGIGRGGGEHEQGAVASAKRGPPYDQLRLPRQFTRRAQFDHAPRWPAICWRGRARSWRTWTSCAGGSSSSTCSLNRTSGVTRWAPSRSPSR